MFFNDAAVGVLVPDVMILMGSKSDLPIGRKAMDVLVQFGISHELHVASAHRTPTYVEELVRQRGAKVFIGIAGVAAALPGMVAAMTTRPVIGVPVSGKVPNDSLLSIVQMPAGIPVATVGVDRGDNAGYLAAQMLALEDPDLGEKIAAQRAKAAEMVLSDDKGIQTQEA